MTDKKKMTQKEIEAAKETGLKLKHELEKLREFIPLDTQHDQEKECGVAGCFGSKLAVFYYNEDPDPGNYKDGADALSNNLGFIYRRGMQDYLDHWWPNQNANDAFGGGYYAYEGYSNDYAGIWQAWMDCADNMIEGRQLR